MKKIFTLFSALMMVLSMSAATQLRGTLTDWSTGKEFSGDPLIVQLDLTAGTTHEFKVVENDTWLGKNGTIKSSITGWEFKNSEENNCKLEVNITGTYTFTWNASTKKLDVTYPEGEVVEIEHTYTIAGSSTELFGTSWDVANKANDLTKQADGTYKLEKKDVVLSAGAIEYKVALDHSWGNAFPSQNQTYKIEKAGKYDVVFTANPTKQEVSATATFKEDAKVIPTIELAGTMNGCDNWNDCKKVLTPAEDQLTASITVNLTAQQYTFKIVKSGTWLGNNGTMTRDNSTGWVFRNKQDNGTDDEVNCSLTADATGDYTFTWTYATNTLTVTFPAETGEEIQHTYTVVGPEAMFGTNWDTNSADNVMTKQADGSYTKTLTDVTLAANATYEYKIVRDKSWEWKELGDANRTFQVDKSGIYDITFVLNAEATDAEVKTTLKKEETIILDAYVAGNEALTGSNFTLEEKNKMTYDSETETYSHTLTGLKANTYYELKVVHGSAWLGYDKLSTVPAGVTEGENQNICFKLASDGNLTVTYNATAGITLEGQFYVFDGSNQPSTLYFRPNTAWKSDNARFAAYFYGTAEKWDDMTDADGDGIYEVANDKTNANVIFCRMDPDVAENNWDSKWNQTGDIEIPNAAINLNTCYAFWTNNIDNTAGTWVVPETIGSGDNSAFYTKYAGKTINVIVERTFTKGVLHTICLPFSLPANWIGTAHQLSSVKSNDANELVVYTKKCTTLEAGKPYILEPTNDELAAKEYLLVDNVTISTTPTNNTAQNKDFIVTLKGILSSDNSQTNGTTEYYIGTDGKLHQDATNKLALRSIVEITNASGQPVQGVRARVAFNENVETGVEDLFSTDAPVKVIENGQLIIIRDGVKYNVQGQMVK